MALRHSIAVSFMDDGSVQHAIEVFCPSFYDLVLVCDQFLSVRAKHG